MRKFFDYIFCWGLLLPGWAWYIFIAFGIFYYSHVAGFIFGVMALLSILYILIFRNETV